MNDAGAATKASEYAPSARRTRMWFVLGLSKVTVIGFAPLVCILTGAVLAGAFGCRVDEGIIHPCMARGRDIGMQLRELSMMGWLALLTSPLMLASVAGWIVVGA